MSGTGNEKEIRVSSRATKGQRPPRFQDEISSSAQDTGKGSEEVMTPAASESGRKSMASNLTKYSKADSTANREKVLQLAKIRRSQEVLALKEKQLEMEIEKKRLAQEVADLEEDIEKDSDLEEDEADIGNLNEVVAERTASWTKEVSKTKNGMNMAKFKQIPPVKSSGYALTLLEKEAAAIDLQFQIEAEAFERRKELQQERIKARRELLLEADGKNADFQRNLPQATTDPKLIEAEVPAIILPSTAISKPGLTPMEKFVARQSAEKDLPQFWGNPEEWPRFIKRFRQSTVSCQFSETENIARLEKALKGNAKEIVQSVLALSDDVEEVIAILEMNFGRTDLIIGTLIEKARRTPAVREDRQETIVEFGNSIRSLVANIVALDSPGHLFNCQLLKEMEDKLPGSMKTQWGAVKCSKKGQVTLKDFADFIKVLALNASYVSNPNTSTVKTDHGRSNFQQQSSRGNRRDSVMAVDTHRSEKNQEKPCRFCAKTGHTLPNCHGFKNLNQNQKWVCISDLKLCFACLKPGHRLQQCQERKSCRINGCDKPHHPSLHPNQERAEIRRKEPVGAVCNSTDPEQVYLRILPVTLKGPYGEVATYAFLDPGATCSIIQASMSNKLGLRGPSKLFRMEFADSSCSEDSGSQRVKVEVSPTCGGQTFFIENVRTARKLNLPHQTVNVETLSRKWKHLQNAPQYCSFENVQPTILIGEDNHQLLKVEETFEGPTDSPSLSRCRLGYFIHGSQNKIEQKSSVFFVNSQEIKDPLHQMMQDSFKIDALGMEVQERHLVSREEERSLSILESTTKRVGGRWETGLLWKKDTISLPESKTMALQRLRSMERKMDKNEIFAQEYCSKILDYLKKGYARVLTEEEVKRDSPKTWYLPHFATSNPNKPGKMRLVFDAAARSCGISLNENLMKGPDMLKSLIGILINFRQYEIAFGGDIREMFHQVNIRSEDLPAQRFLWRGMERDEPPEVLELSVMTFGSTSSPCSAQYVKNRNALEFETEFSEAARAITKRHYVDDYFDSKPMVEEASKLAQEVIDVHQRGGFEIRNWVSNSEEFMKSIPEDLRGSGVVSMTGSSDSNLERILGVNWQAKEDVFTFRLSFSKVDKDIMNGSRIPTKREVLGLVMSIYDPLGFVGHFTVKGKILLKNIWISEIGWDDQIKGRQVDQWNGWIMELKLIERVKIPRCYSILIPTADSIQLHVFCDASEEAFCSAAYIRVESKGRIETNFVMSKTRVSPKKVTSIPRLELQAALLGTRMATLIREELETVIPTTHYWSDSKTVLYWLRSDTRQFKQFVANRVGEIEETSDISNWHWVPTQENVADEGTRSNKTSEFEPDSRWFNGPAFLLLREEDWPKEGSSKSPEEGLTEQVLERKTDYVNVISTTVSALPDVSRFSTWTKLIRTTAQTVRYVKNCWNRRMKIPTVTRSLTVVELRYAEKLWNRQCQMESFPEEVSRFSSGKQLQKSSRLNQLSPFMDEYGVLRMKGRLAMAKDVDLGLKFPVILDPCHPYTKLLIDHYHVNGGHHGTERIINEIRQSFWILNLGSAVKIAWTRCQPCKNSRAKPVMPEMGAIPMCRLKTFAAPFTITGLDFFGPLEVTVGRRREKRWVALFMCMTTRAIHCEIAERLDTDAAINAIRRFISIRGKPQEIHSDNGTNFKGADGELRKALKELDQPKIQSTLSQKGIEWKFIPPSAPHMGGSWERLIRSVKVAMNAILKEQAPREKVLETVLKEATYIVNGRPLTHVSVDPEDPESLTPNHFLIGSSGADSGPGLFDDSDLFGRKQWRIAQRLTDHFWKRWTKEYLPTLSRRCKWHTRVPPLKIGDIVVIADYNGPRNQWPLGIIINTHPGKDEQVRVVTLRTSTGIYKRPVAKLCKLDVHREDQAVPS